MPSRRVFLLSALALPGLSILQGAARGAELCSEKVLVLTENTCADTEAFSACLPATRIEADPSSMLLALDSCLREAEYDVIFGLSRDSNFMLIEQYAQASAYRLTYQGTHRYGPRGLTHSLKGNKKVINYLSTQISKEGLNWTGVISQVPALSSYRDQLLREKNFITTHSCPEQSPGYLVSWLFRRSLS